MWNPLKDILLFVLPPFCPLCKKPLQESESVVCEDCFQQIPFITAPFCQGCGTPLKSRTRDRCPRCRRGDSPITRGRGVGVYHGALLELVQLLKYRRKVSIAKRVGTMMGGIALADPVLRDADLIVPVPLHRTRLRERGYNQAELLAQRVAENMGIPLSARSLVRKRATKTQTLLDEKERLANVKDAFAVAYHASVEKRRIILVDDVLTTGATLKTAASALLQSGAEEVYGLVAAIAPA